MLFLLNDAVLNLTAEDLEAPLDKALVANTRMDIISGLVAEMFAANPSLHRTDLAKAKKVAILVATKAPEINAALFVAAGPGCEVSQVTCRYAQVAFDALSRLYMGQSQGRPMENEANREVWRHLAAA